MNSLESEVAYLHPPSPYSTGELQALQLYVLAVFGNVD